MSPVSYCAFTKGHRKTIHKTTPTRRIVEPNTSLVNCLQPRCLASIRNGGSYLFSSCQRGRSEKNSMSLPNPGIFVTACNGNPCGICPTNNSGHEGFCAPRHC